MDQLRREWESMSIKCPTKEAQKTHLDKVESEIDTVWSRHGVPLNKPAKRDVKATSFTPTEAEIWSELITLPEPVLQKMDSWYKQNAKFNSVKIRTLATKMVRICAIQELKNESNPFCAVPKTTGPFLTEFQKLGTQLRELILADLIDFLNASE